MSQHKSDFKGLAEISRDIAQVVFASVVVSQLVAKVDTKDWLMIISGVVGSLLLWSASLVFARKGYECN